MALIKCKMCGGDIELAPDKTFGTCESCGSTMTFPKVSDEQRAAAFNRGNHFRRIGEFDKALAVYERIVREDDTDAEAHWCCALCRFGIEYVEDPASYEWLPTCHRASFDSFLEDVDYLAALNHSDGITRRQYQKDAAKIAEVQRGILTTSQNTEPFDVFICYKETDQQGNRTRDSLLAQDIYYQLTEQGRKVFFSRITLEDLAGTQYEPYIFAALNSAKVMVAVGTKPEHLSAVWVKNEWSRFLAMMKKDRSKMLLPCYRDMDPYDLPEQLSVLQSYDMSKIGFIQDLTRGIAKVLDAEKKPVKAEPVIVQQTSIHTAPLLRRAFMFLEDGNWTSAEEYCEKVLDQEPENAMAYVGKMMATLQLERMEQLADADFAIESMDSFQKALRFADAELKQTLTEYAEAINAKKLEALYQESVQKMNQAHTEDDYMQLSKEFANISQYRNAEALATQCVQKAKLLHCTTAYEAANLARNTALSDLALLEVAKQYDALDDFEDSKALAAQCREESKQLHQNAYHYWAAYQPAKEKIDLIQAQQNSLSKEKDSYVSRLKVCKQRQENLKVIDGLQEQLQQKQKQKKLLEQERQGLGLFARAKKQEMTIKIEAAAMEVSKASEALKATEKLLNGCPSKEALLQDIALLDSQIQDCINKHNALENQKRAILQETNKTLSHLQERKIIAVLAKDPKIITAVMETEAIFRTVKRDEQLRAYVKNLDSAKMLPMGVQKRLFGKDAGLDVEAIYYQACQALAKPARSDDLVWAASQFRSIAHYKDSSDKLIECENKLKGRKS